MFENLLIMGSATNQEYDSAPGDIRAFDVRTGELVWTFHTVPRPGEFGYDTWPQDAWKTVGGANNWGEQSIDAKRGIVYVPTGSPKFNFYGGNRKGANLFGDCLIALDARTGKRLWHFQTVHHDIWDLDNNSAPQLTTIRQDGRSIDVVAVASKTGYLYVFDRVTGKPIWPIEERPVPQKTTVPGEALSPTQPFPTAPPPFSRQKFTADDVNPYILTPEERDAIQAAHSQGAERRAVHADRIRGSDPHARQSGGIQLGQHRREPGRRQRLRHRLQRADDPATAQAGRDRARAAAVRAEVVKEGRYVTEGFGLYPTIVNPPYTTLTAYDLNKGTHQVADRSRRRSAAGRAGHHGHGHGGDGRRAESFRPATGLRVRHRRRPQGPRVRQQFRQGGLGLAVGWPDDGVSLDVRARRAAVSSGHDVSGGRSVGRTRRRQRRRAAPPTGIVAYALPAGSR